MHHVPVSLAANRNDSPLGGALFLLGFGAATAFLPGTLAPGLAGRWALLAVLVPLCLLLAPRSDRTGWFWAWIAAAMIGIAAFSLSWTPDFLGGIDELVHLAIIVLAFWLGANVSNISAMWRGTCWGVAISAAFVFLQLAGYDGVQQAVSPAGLFMNKNVAGEAAMVTLIVAVSRRWWVFAAISAAMSLATGSRAVLGALVLILAYWIAPRAPRLAGVLGALVVAAVVIAFSGAVPSAGVRLDIWAAALASASPWGNGIGSFAADFPLAMFAHSEPLHAIYELGLPWTFAAAVLFAVSVWRRDASVEGEQSVVVAVGAVSLLSFPLHMPFTAFAVAVATGHVLGARGLLCDREHARGADRLLFAGQRVSVNG